MTNLTEQWNKGKLPEGDYYIKRRNGSTPYDNIDSHGVWRNSIDEDIVEVLAEVPSFELWKAVHIQWKVLLEENAQLKSKLQLKETAYDFDTARLEEENTKLKELLKECKHIMLIEKDFASCHFEKDKLCKLLTEINQVLGE